METERLARGRLAAWSTTCGSTDRDHGPLAVAVARSRRRYRSRRASGSRAGSMRLRVRRRRGTSSSSTGPAAETGSDWRVRTVRRRRRPGRPPAGAGSSPTRPVGRHRSTSYSWTREASTRCAGYRRNRRARRLASTERVRLVSRSPGTAWLSYSLSATVRRIRAVSSRSFADGLHDEPARAGCVVLKNNFRRIPTAADDPATAPALIFARDPPSRVLARSP